MRKLIYCFILSLIICQNSFAEYTINFTKALNAIKKDTKNDNGNNESSSLNEILKNKSTTDNEENGTLSIGGEFHFFLSNTNESAIYESDDIQNMMQNEGYINFVHKNNIDDYISYSIASQVKKKFSNNIRIRNVLEIENKNLGKIQLSNYRKIQDDLFVNTYWIKAGSDNAWDSNVNLLLSESAMPNDHIINGVLTGYDTALTYGADTDSGTIAYYTPSSNPIIFGIAYTPKVYYEKIKNELFNYKDIFTAAAMYNKDINEETNIKLSILGEIGSPAKNPESERKITGLNAIHFGGIFKYSDFLIAGTFGFFNDSGHLSKISLQTGGVEEIFSDPKNSYYYDIATSYDINQKTKLSFSYFHSVYAQDYPITDDNDSIITGRANLQNISLALDYKLYGDAFKPYVEINKFTINDNDAVDPKQRNDDNDGWVIVLGAKSKF
jgi:hypothetical protein